MTINSPTSGFENAPEEEVVESWAGGAIRIVKQFDVNLDREVEYAEKAGY